MNEELLLERLPKIDSTVSSAIGNSSLGTTCVHRIDEGFFKVATIKRKMETQNARKRKASCDTCEGCLTDNLESPQAADWMCVSCGFLGCDGSEKHAVKHFRGCPPGSEHPIFLKVSSDHCLRCFKCEVSFSATQEKGIIVQEFINEYSSVAKVGDMKTNSIVEEASLPNDQPNDSVVNELPIVEVSENENDVNEGREQCTKEVNSNAENNDEEKIQKSWNTEKDKNSWMEGVSDGNSGKGSDDQLPTVEGIPNLGNTCFFNSIMQCLLHTHPLATCVDYIYHRRNIYISADVLNASAKKNLCSVPYVNLSLSSSFGSLSERFACFLQDHRCRRSLYPSLLFNEIVLKAPCFRGYGQQDAHELLRYLLDGLRTEEINRIKRSIADYIKDSRVIISNSLNDDTRVFAEELLKVCGRPLLDAVFGGTLLQTVKCSHCGHLSRTFEDFLDLSLCIPKIHRNSDSDDDFDDPPVTDTIKMEVEKSGGSNIEMEECLKPLGDDSFNDERVCSLLACLRAFTASETLSAANAYECEKCCLPFNKQLNNGMTKKGVEATRKYMIYEPPAVLTLHLKRFAQVQQYNRVTTHKVSGHVSFPLLLDIAPFCSKTAKRVVEGSRRVLYSLYGIVSHSGGLSGGHYVALVRNRRPSPATEKFFFEAADIPLPQKIESEFGADVDPTNGNSAVVQEGKWYHASDSFVYEASETQVLNSEAYILFYERIL